MASHHDRSSPLPVFPPEVKVYGAHAGRATRSASAAWVHWHLAQELVEADEGLGPELRVEAQKLLSLVRPPLCS